ncbi:MAG TPA: cell division protein FtsZ [Rhizomicrobium sp.]|nr:cell division protein FtsZ [Rhizomicrobium sp.]
MTINFRAPETTELKPRITVLGVGGAGGNAVNNMISSKLEGVEFVVANTDAQSLIQSKATRKIQMGARVTEGLGAGAQPDIGRAGAEESLDEILEQIGSSHMVFITAGMGGGTGTGAAPVIARAVRELGILTVGVVTKPFAFEGDKRMRIAERGILELQNYVHTLIVIPNQNLFRVANDRTTFAQAFTMADEVLHSGVRGVTDLIMMPGLINLDFADIKSVISEMGKAMMGTGEAEGEDRAQKAADAAICNPLLEDVSMKGARGVLINITGGPDLMLFEVEQAANRVRAEVDPDANIIFGNTILDDMEGRIRVSVVATGIDADQMRELPENIERLRPRGSSAATTQPKVAMGGGLAPVATVSAITRASANPVHRQVEALAEELNAAPAMTQEDDMVSFHQEEPLPEPAPLPEVATLRAPPPAPRPEPIAEVHHAEPQKKSGLFGLFGRSRRAAEPRHEPAPTPVAQPRATSQVIARIQPEPARNAAVQQAQGDDLFPDQRKDEQFEIPAFLRRQTN